MKEDVRLADVAVGRPGSLRDRIYQVLRKRILTGALAPGSIIDEKALAMAFNVSRTPVREAVKKLTDENLVDVKAQSRTFVKPIDRKLIHEAFLIRRALEIECTGLAAERVTKDDLHQLEDIQVLHGLALQRKRFVEAIGHDDRFHRAISSIGDLPRFWQVIEVSKAHLDRCRYLTVPRPGRGEATLVQHRAVIKALSQKSAGGARKAMADHLDDAYQHIVAFLDQDERLHKRQL
jgi:GntR family transcriptional regulator, rspAB operon transcriptional repressor